MKIAYALPPCWNEILAAGLRPDVERVLVTYGDTIYNPGHQVIPNHLLVHEAVHARQQGDDPAGWWKKYLADPTFRIAQELEAYHAQYEFFCRSGKSFNKATNFLIRLGQDLSGPTYGNVMDVNQAIQQIKNFSL